MGNLVTVVNNYDNGVCSGFTIYTGTTYNGHSFTIPPSANSIGFHTLPYTFDVGNYTGPLYIFLEHCDNHISPPPNEDPKKQGGFQVELIDIDCEFCPPDTDALDCRMDVSFVEDSVDCTMVVSFSEFESTPTPTPTDTPIPTYTPVPTQTPTPTPTADCNMTVTFEEECYCFVVHNQPQNTTETYTFIDCNGVTRTENTPTDMYFSLCAQDITSVSNPKITWSITGNCTNGVCPPNDPV